jgi:hypothetical protein
VNISPKSIADFLIATSQCDGDPSEVCKILDIWLLDWAQQGMKADVDLITDHLQELAFKMKTFRS